MERLCASLNDKSKLPLEELLKKVKTDVDTFAKGEDQFDDISMLAVCRNK